MTRPMGRMVSREGAQDPCVYLIPESTTTQFQTLQRMVPETALASQFLRYP